MWYWPSARSANPWAAIVTYVWDDNMVNLAVWDHDGNAESKTSVPIVQDGSPYPAGDFPYVEWMPYQIGQAKKHETDKA